MKYLKSIIWVVAAMLISSITATAQVDAGFDITYVVGDGEIDLFTTASTTDGYWTVSGGNQNGSMWSIGYESFVEPYKDFIATLTSNTTGESDTKTIRAYNKLNPIIFQRDTQFDICENGGVNISNLETTPTFEPFTYFVKKYFYDKNNSGTWVEYNNPLKGNVVGPGTHMVRERYINVVNTLVYTDVETPINVRATPNLFWALPVPQLCTTSGAIDISTFLNTTTGVTYSSNAGAAFTGTTFDPSVSGVGEFMVSASLSINQCSTNIGVVVKVVNPCE